MQIETGMINIYDRKKVKHLYNVNFIHTHIHKHNAHRFLINTPLYRWIFYRRYHTRKTPKYPFSDRLTRANTVGILLIIEMLKNEVSSIAKLVINAHSFYSCLKICGKATGRGSP